MPLQELATGDIKEFHVDRAAHGGQGIAIDNGRVVFIPGTYPGDHVCAQVIQLKKSFAKAEVQAIIEPSPIRSDHRCPAAALGAGCCDYSTINPVAETQLKADILLGQLQRLAGLHTIPTIKLVDMPPATGWRTRMRLGVNNDGYAGIRKLRSTEIIATQPCSQAVPGLLDDVVGTTAQRFKPQAELVAVLDDAGQRHLIETYKPARGRRSNKVIRVIEGNGMAVQRSGDYEFRLPATEFWQAHKEAINAYSAQITQWCSNTQPHGDKPVAWDLFGGVGALIPPLLSSLGADAHIESVEASADAAKAGQQVFDTNIRFHSAIVESIVDELTAPDIVLLDPPRVGAGKAVITHIAARRPQRIIHIGCDSATFARDAKNWQDSGYRLEEVFVFNAFPGTHHFETLALLEPVMN